MKSKNYNKGGRPILPDYEKKRHSVNVRFSDMEYRYLNICAKECGLRPAEFARRATLDQKISPVLTEEERSGMRMLRNLGNNLNQYMRRLHKGEDVRNEIEESINVIVNLLKRLK